MRVVVRVAAVAAVAGMALVLVALAVLVVVLFLVALAVLVVVLFLVALLRRGGVVVTAVVMVVAVVHPPFLLIPHRCGAVISSLCRAGCSGQASSRREGGRAHRAEYPQRHPFCLAIAPHLS